MDTENDNDFIGIVFGYQSSSQFYVVMWKKLGQPYWDEKPFLALSDTGLTIKVTRSCFRAVALELAIVLIKVYY